MMTRVMPPEHIGIERRPGFAAFDRRHIGARREGVAGRADPHHRVAGLDELANTVELILRKNASPHADEQHVGVVERSI